jgi:hypothetical protein
MGEKKESKDRESDTMSQMTNETVALLAHGHLAGGEQV